MYSIFLWFRLSCQKYEARVHIISKVIPPIYKMSSEVILLNIKETLVLNIYIYIQCTYMYIYIYKIVYICIYLYIQLYIFLISKNKIIFPNSVIYIILYNLYFPQFIFFYVFHFWIYCALKVFLTT